MKPARQHATHPYRQSDPQVKAIAITTVIAVAITSTLAYLLSRGADLLNTTDASIPLTTQAMWGLAAYAAGPCLLLMIGLWLTRLRALGFVLGWLVIMASIALLIGSIMFADGDLVSALDPVWIILPGVLIPIGLGVFILTTALSIPDIARGRDVP